MVTEEEIAELLKTPEGRKILDDMLNEFSLPAEQLSEGPPEPALESIDASPYGNAGGVDPNMPLGVDPNMPPPTLPQDVDPNMPQMQGANMTPEDEQRRRMMAQLMGGFRGVG